MSRVRHFMSTKGVLILIQSNPLAPLHYSKHFAVCGVFYSRYVVSCGYVTHPEAAQIYGIMSSVTDVPTERLSNCLPSLFNPMSRTPIFSCFSRHHTVDLQRVNRSLTNSEASCLVKNVQHDAEQFAVIYRKEERTSIHPCSSTGGATRDNSAPSTLLCYSKHLFGRLRYLERIHIRYVARTNPNKASKKFISYLCTWMRLSSTESAQQGTPIWSNLGCNAARSTEGLRIQTLGNQSSIILFMLLRSRVRLRG